MPRIKRQESQQQQSERFKRDAQKLIDDGALNPIEADRALESALRGVAKPVKNVNKE